MKLLKGDGKFIEIRDVGEVIYTMEVKENLMLPLHGFKIMSDEKAREFIKLYQKISNNKAIK